MGWEILPEWQEALEALVETGGTVLILGPLDSGKSTLCTWAAQKALEAGRQVAVIDSDVGQSAIGPPGTLGLAFPPLGFESLGQVRPAALAFVGAVTPEGRFLEMVLGLEELHRRARARGAEVILVDTTGYIQQPAARALKAAKIRALRPRHLWAIGERDLLEPILAGHEHLAEIQVWYLPSSSQVRPRSREERRQAREEAFRRYFARAHLQEVALAQCLLSGTRLGKGRPLSVEERRLWEAALEVPLLWGQRSGEEILLVGERFPMNSRRGEVQERTGISFLFLAALRFHRLLVGLADGFRRLMGLGLLMEMDWDSLQARILTPVSRVEAVREVLFGGLRLDPQSGQELERLRPGEL